MSDANFASLSSSLLARKGGAKPAMRPQSGLQGPVDGKAAAANLEDLGWNDMGEDVPAFAQASAAPNPAAVRPAAVRPAAATLPRSAPAQVVPIAPQAAAQPAPQGNQVRDSIERIAAHLERPAPAPAPTAAPAARIEPIRRPAPAPAAAPAPSASALALAAKRAAFTLRLDHERHLQLRLACTVRGRSAQQLVTDALDALLAEMPEIASLAAQVKRDGH